MISGTAETPETLLRAVYPELRQMAAGLLRRERADHTLQRTALVHEAFIRLFGKDFTRAISPQEFIARAAHQMREILIDYARKHKSKKRGGDCSRVPLVEADLGTDRDDVTLLSLDEALDRLSKIDPRASSVVELKFFGGHTNAETGAILGISDGTVEADWQFARSWLYGVFSDKRHTSRL